MVLAVGGADCVDSGGGFDELLLILQLYSLPE